LTTQHLPGEQNGEDDEGDESNPDFENGQSEPTKNFSKLEKHWWQPTPGFSVGNGDNA